MKQVFAARAASVWLVVLMDLPARSASVDRLRDSLSTPNEAQVISLAAPSEIDDILNKQLEETLISLGAIENEEGLEKRKWIIEQIQSILINWAETNLKRKV